MNKLDFIFPPKRPFPGADISHAREGTTATRCCVFGPSVNPGEENSQDLHSAILSKTGRHVMAQTSESALR